MRSKSHKSYACKYPSCKNTYTLGKINKHYFKFPRWDPQCSEWKEICQIPKNVKASNFRLCEDHFSENQFFSSERKRLIYGAIPSIPQSESKPHGEPNTLPVYEQNTDNTRELVHSELIIDGDFKFLTQDYNEKNKLKIVKHEIIMDNEVTGCNIKEETGIFSCLDTSSKDLMPSQANTLPVHEQTTDNTLEHVKSEDFKFLTQNWDEENEIEIVKHEIIIDNEVTGCNIKEETGILYCLDTSKTEFKPDEELMYKMHRIMFKISKLKLRSKNDRNKIKILKELAEKRKFQILEEKINEFTKQFIDSQLRYYNRILQAK